MKLLCFKQKDKRPKRKDDPDPDLVVDVEQFPGYTEYEKKCCCCYTAGTGKEKVTYWGHWRVKLQMPLAMIVLSGLDLGILVYFCGMLCGILGYVWISITGILWLLFIISLIKTIRVGPGYFPFYWNWAKENKLPETDDPTVNGVEESLAGIAINEVQYKWSKAIPQPPRCTMSRLAQRFVIRPDHYCSYIGCWVGKRNHKLFMLTCFYGCAFAVAAIIGHIISMAYLTKENMIYNIIIGILGCMFMAANAYKSGFFFKRNWRKAKINQTSWEKWNNLNKYIIDENPENFAENQKQVFGENLCCCAMFCPCEAFPGVSNEELVEGYETYASIRERAKAENNGTIDNPAPENAENTNANTEEVNNTADNVDDAKTSAEDAENTNAKTEEVNNATDDAKTSSEDIKDEEAKNTDSSEDSSSDQNMDDNDKSSSSDNSTHKGEIEDL